MRAVILIGAGLIAEAINSELIKEKSIALITLICIAAVADVWDFINKKINKHGE